MGASAGQGNVQQMGAALGAPPPGMASALGASQQAMTMAPSASGGKGGAQGVQQAQQNAAQGFAGTPYEQAAKAQQNALGATQVAMGYQPMMAQGQGYNAERIGAGQLGSTNLDPYMNKYTEDVIKANEADILRGATMGINQLGAQAQAAKAFGGSRQAIAEAEYGRNVAQQLAQSSAGLRQQGFTQAQNMAQQDIATRMQADLANQAAYNQAAQFGAAARNAAQLANQQASLAANQQRLGAAGQLSGLGQTSFGYGETARQAQLQADMLKQGINQGVLDQGRADYATKMGYPQQNLGFLANILNPAPHGETTTKNPGLFDYLTLALS